MSTPAIPTIDRPTIYPQRRRVGRAAPVSVPIRSATMRIACSRIHRLSRPGAVQARSCLRGVLPVLFRREMVGRARRRAIGGCHIEIAIDYIRVASHLRHRHPPIARRLARPDHFTAETERQYTAQT